MESFTQKIIFTHIPKTAGTTIRDILENQYRSNSIALVYSQENIQYTLNNLLASNNKVIMGHFRHPNFITPTNILFLTFLREPVKRIISHYNYVSNSKDKVHIALMQKASTIQEFVQLESQQNLQTKYLSGLSNEDFAKAPQAALAKAKENIDSYMVGITERFDESIVFFKEKLNWKKPYYTTINKSKKRTTNYDTQTQELISSCNSLDIELYTYALDKFENQLSLLTNFDEKLNTYQAQNKKLKNLYFVKHRVKLILQKILYRLTH